MADNKRNRRARQEQDQDELGIDWKAAWETEDNYWSGTPSAWDEIKAAVRDAWNRVASGRAADGEVRHPQIRE